MGGKHVSVADLGRHDQWGQVRALVAGFGASGYAAADTLTFLGAQVIAVDEVGDAKKAEQAHILTELGATIRIGPGSTAHLPKDIDLVVTSPGWNPGSRLLTQALERGVPIWGEVELAWRLRDPESAAPWLVVTGTNGKTTTVGMLQSILRAAGLRSAAVGNIGRPVVEAVMDPQPYDVLAVELSSFQLHYSASISPHTSACLNFAEDHLDWYASIEEYRLDKAKVYQNTQVACVYNVEDAATEQMVRDAEVVEGARAIGFTLGTPAPSMVGVVDDILADRAFVDNRATSAAELATTSDLASNHPHYVRNALAAAAVARAFGVPPIAVRDGLRSYRPDAHRIQLVTSHHGVDYVNDSKATNPHAAASSMQAYQHIVWIAGGLAKGAAFDDLIVANRQRLRGVVLLGQDRDVIAQSLLRHAPDVPVIDVSDGKTETVMDRAVQAAASLATSGDTVLLAPGCASMDLFKDYGARGDAFAQAARGLGAG
jgi:UDP-N-acetylmuramoylalanine--D-glutamate ligase